MPVQVGDDNLLKRMHRGYTLDQYSEIVARNCAPPSPISA